MKQLSIYFVYIFLMCFIFSGCATHKYIKDPNGNNIPVPRPNEYLNKYKKINLRLDILSAFKGEIGLNAETEIKLDTFQQDYLMEANELYKLAPTYIVSGHTEKFLIRTERLEKTFKQLRFLNMLLNNIKNSEDAKNNSKKLKITIDYLIENYINNFGNVDSEPPDVLTLDKIEKLAKEQTETKNRITILEAKSNSINSLELRIMLDFFPKKGIGKEEGKSIGIDSVVALSSADNIIYRFITDGTWVFSKLKSDRQRLTLIYKPESPEQILGKKINILRDMSLLRVNYSEFFKTIGLNVDDHFPIIFNVDMFINGIQVVSISQNVLQSTICNGQASMNIRQYFNNIDEKYKTKISNEP